MTKRVQNNIICGLFCAGLIYICGLFFPVDMTIKGLAFLVGIISPLFVDFLSSKKSNEDVANVIYDRSKLFFSDEIQQIKNEIKEIESQLNNVENMAIASQVSLTYTKTSDILEKLTILETRVKYLENYLNIED